MARIQKLFPALFVAAIILCGCAHQYVINLSNGRTITTASKPKLKGNSYYYKDAKGAEIAVPAGSVRQIEPASMAKEDADAKKKQFQTQTQKKRHWYWPF